MLNWIKNFKTAFPKEIVTIMVVSISVFADLNSVRDKL